MNLNLIDVFSAGGELLYAADDVEARYLLESGQVKRWHHKHVRCLRYYSGVDPDDGPLVKSPRSIHGGSGVRGIRVYVPENERRERPVASGVFFEHAGLGVDPARAHREREAREKQRRISKTT